MRKDMEGPSFFFFRLTILGNYLPLSKHCGLVTYPDTHLQTCTVDSTE